MKNKIQDRFKKWLKSWRYTYHELHEFVSKNSRFVIVVLLATYGIVYGILLGQYYVVKAKSGNDYLTYKTIIVSDVALGQQATGIFIRDSKGQYDGYGKIEFSVHDEENKSFTPPQVDYPKFIIAGHEEQKELIPTEELKAGKYSFILHRKFTVDTWIGWRVEKEVTAVSDEFEVKTEFKNEQDYLNEMQRLYNEFIQRTSEFNVKFPNAQVQYVPEIQQQVIVMPQGTTSQKNQPNTSGSGNPNAPGQQKKNR